MQKMKLVAAAIILIAGCGGAVAQSYGRGDPAWAYTGDPHNNPRWQRGYDAYAAVPVWHRRGMYRGMYQAQSGGNGSPVAAGSWRGSTDRSSPNSPFASGPYGDGERPY